MFKFSMFSNDFRASFVSKLIMFRVTVREIFIV